MSKTPKLPAKVIQAAADAFANDTATRRSLHAIGLPARLYPAIRADAEDIRKRFNHELSVQMGETLMDMTERLRAESGKLSTGQLPVAIGILTDKVKALNESGGPTSQHLHLHLGSNDRTGAITALLGKHGERLVKPVEPA